MSLIVEQDKLSLREKTLTKLREAIAAGYFKAGERLVERDICARTEVSRTSLREALRHLESEGLVESRKGVGVFVASLSLDDVRDIYEVRRALDAEATRLFTKRATEKQRNRLCEVMKRLADIPHTDHARAHRANIEFFEIIYEGAGNKVAHGFMQSLQTRTSMLRSITLRAVTREHYEETIALFSGIVEAIEARKENLASKLCREFVIRSEKFSLSVFGQK
ncbi:DNA-binding GntR family transcriptional regulator [Rhodoligotrophos appendicifer]|uniref:GntR family transcriptional regulator n=1 Tax=Rhodoligotrophos appendicifer TaxID=987056 RepID=UPI0014797964|nr:GntR family transcriptional regulator [Rhodoligotrophos appendicifer]